MPASKKIDLSYFPGCSLSTSAHENNLSLIEFSRKIGFNLIEIEDWNCCGSSSAHSINPGLAMDLIARNLFMAPSDRPLLVACPNCILRLRETHQHLANDETKRREYENLWNRPFNRNLKIIHFFEILEDIDLLTFSKNRLPGLQGLKFVPYYGCMLARPFTLRHEKNYHDIMEKALSSLGAISLSWPYKSRCCGTFLSVAKPDIITKVINKLVQGAVETGAECIITACAMCHLNLEVRCTLKNSIPTIHFSEILSLALGESEHHSWFQRHLVDPRPMLEAKGLI